MKMNVVLAMVLSMTLLFGATISATKIILVVVILFLISVLARCTVSCQQRKMLMKWRILLQSLRKMWMLSQR